MWTYRQSTGDLWRDGSYVGTGYSGAAAGKNNPAMQAVKDVGPVPQGRYTLGYCKKEWGHMGALVVELKPGPLQQPHMFGRVGFFIHGDSIANPGHASDGCIVMAREIRILIATIGDWELEVIE